MLLSTTGVKKIRTDPGDLGFPHLADQLNFYILEPGPFSDSLRERLADAFSDVRAFWRGGSRLWSNKSFLESLENTEDFDDDTRWLCVVAASLLCLDRALVHGDRGHVWKAEDWLDCAQWLRFVLTTWGENKIFQIILTKFEQQNAEARARARNLSERRHVKDNEAREKVQHDWEKDPSRFGSAAKAGRYYTEWLAKQGYPCEPSTPTRWIRDRARELGIKLR